ncbi:hypothetical protein Tco_0277127, partial [Tanacetum coccineum]
NKAVRDGVGVEEIESLGEGFTTKRKGISRQGGSPTSKGDQCDQCKFGKRQKAKRERNDGAVDEHPNIFSSNILKDVSEEPLIVKAEVEGYLVRRVYVDEGSSIEVMFEHCFENLDPRIKARLRETQTDLVGFAREISKPLGKIEPEVCFGNGGLGTRTAMKFIVVRAPFTL